MDKRILVASKLMVLMLIVACFNACSKSDSTPTPPPPTDVCAGKVIVITATPTAPSPCSANGSINVTASGSTNFSFKLNSSGTYQSSGTFANVAAGGFTIFAKDGAGCEKSVTVTVDASGGAPGAQFADVKTLVAAKCQTCHNNTVANGGMNFQVECNIIANKARIKVRAVDEGTMPQGGPLSQSDKNIISNWITGGGGFSN